MKLSTKAIFVVELVILLKYNTFVENINNMEGFPNTFKETKSQRELQQEEFEIREGIAKKRAASEDFEENPDIEESKNIRKREFEEELERQFCEYLRRERHYVRGANGQIILDGEYQGDRNQGLSEEERQYREFVLRDQKIETDRKLELRKAATASKLEKSIPGETMDFSRQHIEGVKYADTLPIDTELQYKVWSWLEKKFIGFLENRKLVEPFNPDAKQQASMDMIARGYDRYLDKYNCNRVDFNRDDVRFIREVDQFGVGGADSLLGNYIYLTSSALSEGAFKYMFSHEYGHFINARVMRKNEKGRYDFPVMGLKREKTIKKGFLFSEGELTVSAYILVEEGVTDLFAIRLLKEEGYEVPEKEISKPYAPFRKVIENISSRLGNGNSDVGLDYFIKAKLTGDDTELIARIDEVYAKSGGYKRFTELLDNIYGYGGVMNQNEQGIKKIIKFFMNAFGFDALKLEDDSNYKKLINWIG